MWIFIVVAAVAVILFGCAYAAYRKAFFVNRRRTYDVYAMPKAVDEDIKTRTRAFIRAFEDVPYEPVEIRSHDGLRLFGRYYHVCDGAPIHIQMHGYRSFAMRDFCGINPLSRACGHNALVVDQRAHGKSEGHTITFGIKEKLDCKRWAEYAAARFGENVPIFLSGVSMGAATVLMASALELPKNVVGVIADCPYSSPRAIIRKVIRDMKLPPAIAYPVAQLGGFLFGGIRNLSRESAVFAVRHAKMPILILHGEADTFVPFDMSREIAGGHRHCTLEAFPNAGHAQSYLVDLTHYEAATKKFISDCLQYASEQSKKENT